MSSSGDRHAARVRPQESKNVFQRYGFPHPAAPHDDARLSMVDKKTHIIENQVLAKSFADIAEFDEVARRGRLCLLRDSRAHAGPLLLMSPRRRSKPNSQDCGAGFSLWGFGSITIKPTG